MLVVPVKSSKEDIKFLTAPPMSSKLKADRATLTWFCASRTWSSVGIYPVGDLKVGGTQGLLLLLKKEGLELFIWAGCCCCPGPGFCTVGVGFLEFGLELCGVGLVFWGWFLGGWVWGMSGKRLSMSSAGFCSGLFVLRGLLRSGTKGTEPGGLGKVLWRVGVPGTIGRFLLVFWGGAGNLLLIFGLEF
uniref:Uncharacterized protein n=1 Tax=Arcella intermedia TaxID=1963864 RepID=A0A6B2LFV8_9EUKA